MPEQGQQNIAEGARTVEQQTPWGQAEEAVKSARVGDFPGTVSGIFGATLLGARAEVAAARFGRPPPWTPPKSVASILAKRAGITTRR